jgi:hypothetical protein
MRPEGMPGWAFVRTKETVHQSIQIRTAVGLDANRFVLQMQRARFHRIRISRVKLTLSCQCKTNYLPLHEQLRPPWSLFSNLKTQLHREVRASTSFTLRVRTMVDHNQA